MAEQETSSTVVRLIRPGTPLERSRLLVENLLRSHGVDPSKHVLSRSEGSYSWVLPIKANQLVVLSVFEAESNAYIRVSAPILQVPRQRQLEFCRRLLDLNSEMVSASLATVGEDVYVVSVRPVQELESDQAIDLVGRVCIYASQYADRLRTEFNAPAWGQTP
ncbi:MAG: YbjN domain-containing protein [Candidatus Eremiobacterota bacterium]